MDNNMFNENVEVSYKIKFIFRSTRSFKLTTIGQQYQTLFGRNIKKQNKYSFFLKMLLVRLSYSELKDKNLFVGKELKIIRMDIY